MCKSRNMTRNSVFFLDFYTPLRLGTMSWTPLDIKISVLFYFVFTITHDQGLNALITSSLVLFLPGFFLAMNYCIPLQWTVLNALYIIQRRKGLKKWPKFVWGRQPALFYCPRILLKKNTKKRSFDFRQSWNSTRFMNCKACCSWKCPGLSRRQQSDYFLS